MSETLKPKYETSPEGLRKRLDDICVDYLAYTCPSVYYKDTVSLYLQSSTGEEVIIQKAIEGTRPKGAFFQDMGIVVLPGTSRTFGAEQVDFNFNQFGDGLLRKRVFSGTEDDIGDIPVGASEETIKKIASITLQKAMETAKNMELAQDMGVDNQPVTNDEVAEAMSYLNGASVLDANNDYQPVGKIDTV